MTLRLLAQGVAHFKDIRYTAGITYGEMFMQNEYEMGRYNLDEADVPTQRTRFELYEQVRHNHQTAAVNHTLLWV